MTSRAFPAPRTKRMSSGAPRALIFLRRLEMCTHTTLVSTVASQPPRWEMNRSVVKREPGACMSISRI